MVAEYTNRIPGSSRFQISTNINPTYDPISVIKLSHNHDDYDNGNHLNYYANDDNGYYDAEQAVRIFDDFGIGRLDEAYALFEQQTSERILCEEHAHSILNLANGYVSLLSKVENVDEERLALFRQSSIRWYERYISYDTVDVLDSTTLVTSHSKAESLFSLTRANEFVHPDQILDLSNAHEAYNFFPKLSTEGQKRNAAFNNDPALSENNESIRSFSEELLRQPEPSI